MNLTRRIAIVALAACLPLAALAQSQPKGCTAKGNAPMKVKLTTQWPIVIELDTDRRPSSSDNS